MTSFTARSDGMSRDVSFQKDVLNRGKNRLRAESVQLNNELGGFSKGKFDKYVLPLKLKQVDRMLGYAEENLHDISDDDILEPAHKQFLKKCLRLKRRSAAYLKGRTFETSMSGG